MMNLVIKFENTFVKKKMGHSNSVQFYLEEPLKMQKIFVIILMTVWSNGEPEIIQYGTSVLGESFLERKDCEIRLAIIAKDQNLKQDLGISGITKSNLVFRSYDEHNRVDQEYSCLEINFKI